MSGFDTSLQTLFTKMESFVSSKTVVGEPIEIGGVVILPLVDISVGVGAGGGGADKTGGGGGLGASIKPSAVIVIKDGSAQMINVKDQDSVNKLIDMIPGVISKLNFGPFKKKSDDAEIRETDFEDDIIIKPSQEA